MPTEFASLGDWIDVENPVPTTLRARLDTPEAVAYGNDLIAAGRWRLAKQEDKETDE